MEAEFTPQNSNALGYRKGWFDSKQHPNPLQRAIEYLAECSPKFDWIGIYVLNGSVLELGPYIGAETEHTRIPVGQGVCGTAVSTGQTQNVADVMQRENYLACSLETRSELVVLIRSPDGQILGQIDIDSHQVSAFGPEEEALVTNVANDLGRLWEKYGTR